MKQEEKILELVEEFEKKLQEFKYISYTMAVGIFIVIIFQFFMAIWLYAKVN